MKLISLYDFLINIILNVSFASTFTHFNCVAAITTTETDEFVFIKKLVVIIVELFASDDHHFPYIRLNRCIA